MDAVNEEQVEKEEGMPNLPQFMGEVIRDLEKDRKYPAMHTYTCTLHSFMDFSGVGGAAMPMNEVFTPGRLKEYEEWLVWRRLSWNTVSTYMRTLHAVYNRWTPPGTPEYNPRLFDNVYTKVTSRTKRALTGQQTRTLMSANPGELPEDQKQALAYFLLMFLLRGMPFVDLAHLRKKDVQGGEIVYLRHKTGKQMTVEIPKDAAGLIRKYRDRNPDSIYLFPILNAMQESGWELYKYYQDALRRFNKSLGRLACTLLPGVKMSSYTARHTWATLALYAGIPIGLISQSLGHSSIRVTEAYLKPFENERINKANKQLIASVRECRQGKLTM